MAVFIEINGIKAYTLLDTGSTTLSITHDFARVANLSFHQLENPVTLQLGTVGSRSVINFGVKANLKLGPIYESDIYLDVVNIYRYNVIIGIPFMRKYGLVLDFNKNTLHVDGQEIKTLSVGQEDLIIVKKRARKMSAGLQSSSPGRSNN